MLNFFLCGGGVYIYGYIMHCKEAKRQKKIDKNDRCSILRMRRISSHQRRKGKK